MKEAPLQLHPRSWSLARGQLAIGQRCDSRYVGPCRRVVTGMHARRLLLRTGDAFRPDIAGSAKAKAPLLPTDSRPRAMDGLGQASDVA
jgi:hypothetical protein